MKCGRGRSIIELVVALCVVGIFLYLGPFGGAALGVAAYWATLAVAAIYLPWFLFGIIRALRSEFGFVYWVLDADGGRSPDFKQFVWSEVEAVDSISNPGGQRGHNSQDRFFIKLRSGRRVKFQRKPRGVELSEVQRFAELHHKRAAST